MKKLKKKYWVMIGVGLFLILVAVLLRIRPSGFEGLDPEDYDDSPELKKLVVSVQKIFAREPGEYIWMLPVDGGLFEIDATCKSDPRYYDLLIMGLDAEPPKSGQFLKYLFNLCLFRDRYSWKVLFNGDYYADEYVNIRREACLSLGELGDKRAVEPLMKRLRDRNLFVRRCACLSLGKIGDRRAVSPLLEMLENDEAKDFAAVALGEIGDEIAFGPLVNMLEDGDSYLKCRAIVGLGKLGGERVYDLLLPFLRAKGSNSVMLTSCTCEALGELGDRRAFEPLVEMLKNNFGIIRTGACRGLGSLGDRRAEKYLIPMLNDDDPEVAIAACEALIKIDKSNGDKSLKEFLSDSEVSMPLKEYLKMLIENRNKGHLPY